MQQLTVWRVLSTPTGYFPKNLANANGMARIGLIGCGMWGRNLARNLSQLGALVSVADRNVENAAAFADEFGGKADSIDAVLDQHDLNGIIVATPAFIHADMAC